MDGAAMRGSKEFFGRSGERGFRKAGFQMAIVFAGEIFSKLLRKYAIMVVIRCALKNSAPVSEPVLRRFQPERKTEAVFFPLTADIVVGAA